MWKSDNQGFKKATLIQTGRRGRDRNGWSHTHMCGIKIRTDPSPRPEHPTQGPRAGKISPPNFWL